MSKLLTITCGSFTAVTLLFMLLSPFGLAPYISNETVFQIFTMSLSIASVMVIAEQLKNDSFFLDILIKVIICYVVVFFEGAFFGMVDFAWIGLAQISPVLVPAFIITYFVQYLTHVGWANNINKKIKQNK